MSTDSFRINHDNWIQGNIGSPLEELNINIDSFSSYAFIGPEIYLKSFKKSISSLFNCDFSPNNIRDSNTCSPTSANTSSYTSSTTSSNSSSNLSLSSNSSSSTTSIFNFDSHFYSFSSTYVENSQLYTLNFTKIFVILPTFQTLEDFNILEWIDILNLLLRRFNNITIISLEFPDYLTKFGSSDILFLGQSEVILSTLLSSIWENKSINLKLIHFRIYHEEVVININNESSQLNEIQNSHKEEKVEEIVNFDLYIEEILDIYSNVIIRHSMLEMERVNQEIEVMYNLVQEDILNYIYHNYFNFPLLIQDDINLASKSTVDQLTEEENNNLILNIKNYYKTILINYYPIDFFYYSRQIRIFKQITLSKIDQNMLRDNVLYNKYDTFLITGGLNSVVALLTIKILFKNGIKNFILLNIEDNNDENNFNPNFPTIIENFNKFLLANNNLKIFSYNINKKTNFVELFSNIEKELIKNGLNLTGLVHSCSILNNFLLYSNYVLNAFDNSLFYLNNLFINIIDKIFNSSVLIKNLKIVLNFSSILSCIGNRNQIYHSSINRLLEISVADYIGKIENINNEFDCLTLRLPGVYLLDNDELIRDSYNSNNERISDESLYPKDLKLNMINSSEFEEIITSFLYYSPSIKGIILSVFPNNLYNSLSTSTLWTYYGEEKLENINNYAIESQIDTPSSLVDFITEILKDGHKSYTENYYFSPEEVSFIVKYVSKGYMLPIDTKENENYELMNLLSLGMDELNAAEFLLDLSIIFNFDLHPSLINSSSFSFKMITDYIILEKKYHIQDNSQKPKVNIQVEKSPIIKEVEKKEDKTVSYMEFDVVYSKVRLIVRGYLLDFDDENGKDSQNNMPLMDLGMDSINTSEFCLELTNQFNLDITPVIIFSYPSIIEISEYIYHKKLQEYNEQNRVEDISDNKNIELEPYINPLVYFNYENIDINRVKSFYYQINEEIKNISNGIVLDSIGITGISIDLPNGINNLSQMWEIMATKGNTASKIDPSRWNLEKNFKLYGIPENNDLINRVKHGNFLTKDQFSLINNNCSLFKLTPKEVSTMSPAHILLLNNTARALADAGYSTKESLDVNTGVFVAIGGQVHSFPFDLNDLPPNLASCKQNDSKINAYSVTSHTTSVAAGRISYAFGFQGPCLSIDTACSSSLSAISIARRSLQLHECNVAIVAGVTVLDFYTSIGCAFTGMTSIDGICHSFDSKAIGYGRSEGCGVIIMKRMADINAASQPIYSIIKGISIQQDGNSNSLTAPNGLAQESVIRNALKDANLSETNTNSIYFVEAHGTGTEFGDPVEVTALANVYGLSRADNNPLYISSIKGNFGHLEAAAGLISLCASIISISKKIVSANSQVNKINPLVSGAIKNLPLVISNRYNKINKVNNEPILCGISSFGYSGTIAHMIIEEPPLGLFKDINDNNALRSINQEENSNIPPDSLYQTNSALKFTEDLFLDNFKLSDFGSQNTSLDLSFTFEDTDSEEFDEIECEEGLVWQFSGQGGLTIQVGRSIYDSEINFRNYLADADAVLEEVMGYKATDILYPDISNKLSLEQAKSLINRAKYAQPILVALEVSLALCLLKEDLNPWGVIGHSLGEYAACIISGVLTFEDGLKLIAARGRIIEESIEALEPSEKENNGGINNGGTMFAIRSTEEMVLQKLEQLKGTDKNWVVDECSLGVVNGRNSVVISGSTRGIKQLMKELSISSGIELAVTHGFHSPLMNPAVKEFSQVLSKVEFKRPKMRFFSTVLGKEICTSSINELNDVNYWIQHLVKGVYYVSAVDTALREGAKKFMELGPSTTLTKLSLQIIRTNSYLSNDEVKEIECLGCIN